MKRLFETMESRVMMTSVVLETQIWEQNGEQMEYTTLRIKGTNQQDTISVIANNVADTDSPGIHIKFGPPNLTILDHVDKIVIESGAGRDNLYVHASGYANQGLELEIYGGVGNDQISAASDSTFWIDGGDGNDTIRNKTDIPGKSGYWINGGKGNDMLVGGNTDDVLQGDDGRDLLYGMAGEDWLSGGTGMDTANGGAGNDYFVVNTDKDPDVNILNGGSGWDTLNASGSLPFVSVLFSIEEIV